jgi:predicted nucleic acid-binding protein
MILADTDVVIDFLRRRDPARSKIRELSLSGQLQTTAVTSFELLCGLSEDRRAAALLDFLSSIEALPMDGSAAEAAAKIHRELVAKGQSIGMADSLIAGIAIANDMPLLTMNRRHFERVPGLTLVPLE